MTPRTHRLLDIQGFDGIDVEELAPVAPWLRLTFGLCGVLGGTGTVLASPAILLGLAHQSAHHPFTGPDGALIYVKTGHLVPAWADRQPARHTG